MPRPMPTADAAPVLVRKVVLSVNTVITALASWLREPSSTRVGIKNSTTMVTFLNALCPDYYNIMHV